MSRLSILITFSSFSVFALSCSTLEYKTKADKEIYAIIADKGEKVFSQSSDFNIDTSYSKISPNAISSERILKEKTERESYEQKPMLLSLEKTLHLAISQSHEYQTKKENLYLAALSLSNKRYDYTPIFSHSSTLTAERSRSGE